MIKAIWVFAGGKMQMPLVTEIQRMGYAVILTDGSDECYCKPYVDLFIHADTFDIAAAIFATQTIESNGYKVEAVITTGADCHTTVSAMAEWLRLPSVSHDFSIKCREKQRTREALQVCGVIQPQFYSCTTIKECQQAFLKIGKPSVMKATDNSGSRGFSVIKSLNDITEDKFNEAISNGTTGIVIVEEMLVPSKTHISELSVETVWQDGTMYVLNAVDRVFSSDINKLPELDVFKLSKPGIEIGHINPSILNNVVIEKMHDAMFLAGTTMGADKEKFPFILKYDMFINENDEPVVIEMTPRLSGGWDSSGSTIARRGNFIGLAINLALGYEYSLDFHYYFVKMDDVYTVILTDASDDLNNCIGRKFFLGEPSYDLSKAILNTLNEKNEGRSL